MRNVWHRIRPKVFASILLQFVRAIGATIRVRSIGFDKLEPGKSYIFCGYHGRSFLAAHQWRGRGYWVLISQSNDGEIQNAIFTGLGFHSIRGSTGRGGERALVESIRKLREGAIMAMTPDGPRGPSGEVQGGVLVMAQKSGAALVPVGVGSWPRWHAKSWDRYIVPKPFARGALVYGEPIEVPAGASPDEIEAIRLRLQEAIHQTEARADVEVGAPA